MKKMLVLLLASVMLVSLLGGCKKTQKSDSGKIKIAVVKLVDNAAFAQMTEGFQNKMEELGYQSDKTEYEILNAQGDSANLNSIATSLKSGSYDLIVTIVTPATQAVVNQEPKAPVVYISVNNPVEAGILTTMDHPDKNATGSSNVVPVDQIFALLNQLRPEAKKIGILYCSGETNAVSNAAKAKECIDGMEGFSYKEATVANSAEVAQTAKLLASEVDAIYIPVDSTVQSAMPLVVEAATANNIPVFGSDPVMVSSGALASISASNEELGAMSAEMADEILKGKKVSEVKAKAISEFECVINEETAKTLGIQIPSDITYTPVK